MEATFPLRADRPRDLSLFYGFSKVKSKHQFRIPSRWRCGVEGDGGGGVAVCRSVVNDDGAEMIDRGREPPATRARVSGNGSRRVIAVVPVPQYCTAGQVAGLRIG